YKPVINQPPTTSLIFSSDSKPSLAKTLRSGNHRAKTGILKEEILKFAIILIRKYFRNNLGKYRRFYELHKLRRWLTKPPFSPRSFSSRGLGQFLVPSE